jgi:hypothetical protein
MAITINGSGTITGITAGGYPDATVTADDLAATLDLSGKTVTLPSGAAGKIFHDSQDVSGTGGYTFSDIPATVREFRVSYHHLSISTTGYVVVYLGGGSLDTSSNYVGVRGYNGGGSGNGASPSTSYQGFQMTDYTSASKTYSGTFTCSKIDGNYWEINWHQHEQNSASQGFFTGYINLGGTLDRVDMSPSAGTWDNGTIAITYIY